jgi:hypothetical protein
MRDNTWVLPGIKVATALMLLLEASNDFPSLDLPVSCNEVVEWPIVWSEYGQPPRSLGKEGQNTVSKTWPAPLIDQSDCIYWWVYSVK